MSIEIQISGLMSVYHGSLPDELRLCLASIYNQTILLDELIIVIDGHIGEELEHELARWSHNITLIRLDSNVGLGRALSEGLKACNFEYVMRFDSDDIFYPLRINTQKDYLKNNPHIDILGTWMEEFRGTPNNVVSIRKVPTSEDVRAFARFRNPINHISVIFKKNSIDLVGGYEHILYAEDYYLWLKAINSGLIIENIPIITCAARVSDDMYKRRTGLSYIRTELKLFALKLSIYDTKDNFLIFCATFLRILIRILPGKLISKIYKYVRQ